MNDKPVNKQTRSRWTLVILVALFSSPIVFAFIVYKNRSLIPTSTKNKGELVQPARPLPDLKLKTLNEKIFVTEDFRRKWSMVYFANQTCDVQCMESIANMRNIRLAQAGESKRVQYFLIFKQMPAKSDLADVIKYHPRMIVLSGAESELDKLMTTFSILPGQSVFDVQQMYLLDPIGNLMMYYKKGEPGTKLLKDLKYLMHWSQVG